MFEILITFVIILVSIYLLVKKKLSYWEERGVPFVKPSFIYGNIKNADNTQHISQSFDLLYTEMKSKSSLGFAGMYFSIFPAVLVTDLDFMKTVMVKDFHYFEGRVAYFNEKDEPLSAHLVNLVGPKWRILRSKLTPTFTSGKMKMIFPIVVSVVEKFKDYLDKTITKDGGTLEVKDLMSSFTTDVIGTCAFGIECNSIEEPNSLFRRMGRKIFDSPKNSRMKNLLLAEYPRIGKFFGFKSFEDDVSEFFMKVVKDTIETRKKNNEERNDFVDLLIKLKDSEIVTFNEIAAQAFVFFMAGYETSSTALTYCIYELALNPEIQGKVRKCIEETLKKYGGTTTYESLSEMTYLDQCINETLRMYPPFTIHSRKVTKDYHVADSNIVLPKGMSVMIPVYSIHRDPEYFPNPEKFDPDRFEADKVAKWHPFAFTPFGEGPRNCIGLRFGMMQVRIGLAFLLNNFKFTTCPETPIPLLCNPKSLVLSPKGGVYLNIEKI